MEDGIKKLIKLAIEEDIGAGDITTNATVDKFALAKGTIRAKEDLIVAGLGVAKHVFLELEPDIKWNPSGKDGDHFHKGDTIAVISGSARALLTGERTALNFLQHLSGIATLTNKFVSAIKTTKTVLLDTRKTTPGYRVIEKYAVKMGGGTNHRMGLFDHFLIKNNNITADGSISKATKLAKLHRKPDQKIEVETRTIGDVKEALGCGVDIIMLDNMTIDLIQKVKPLIGDKAKIEVSGNINLENIRIYAGLGVDYISCGAITHSAPAADINMIIEIIS